MFCWFYAAQAHISCGGATALWMELVECFPNKLGKLLCANSCETNDKIICHTNQCTNSRSSILIYYYFKKKKIQCLITKYYISVVVSVNLLSLLLCQLRAWYPEQFRNQRCATYSTIQYIYDYTYMHLLCCSCNFWQQQKWRFRHHTRREDAESTHSIAARRGPHHIHYVCAAAELSFVVRPMIDGLHYKLATIGTPSPKRARKKNLIHFPVLRLFVDSAARLVISYRHHAPPGIDRANYLNTKEGQNLQTILHHSAPA